MSPNVYWPRRTNWGLFLLPRSCFWKFLLAWGHRSTPLASSPALPSRNSADLQSRCSLVRVIEIQKNPFWLPGEHIKVNLDMTDSVGPGKLVRHMQNPSYTYDEYLICIGLGPSISSVICKNPSYSGPSYPSSPVELNKGKHLRVGI